MAGQQLEKLRKAMADNNIDVYVIVTDDFHASEYVGDYFKCREFISGFNGSAGTLVITPDEAGLWTDGRYFLQAEEQIKGSGIELRKMGEPWVPTIIDYLSSALQNGQTLGYDGRTIATAYADKIKEKMSNKSVNYEENMDLVDTIWTNRPAMSSQPVWILDEKYSGESRKTKLCRLQENLDKDNADAVLISSLDEICWLYNIRGNDVDYNPVVLSYTLVFKDKAVLYLNQTCVSDGVREQLEQDGIILKDYLDVYTDLKRLNNIKVMCDKSTVNAALTAAIPDCVNLIDKQSYVKAAKAVKNPVEMENERAAHVKDGVAVTKLIYWLKNTFGKERITELDVCRKLEELRSAGDNYIEQSFAPIAGSGYHGAIIHYDPTEDTNIELVNNSFLLLDTGGHYLEGTTDVTRTISLGHLSKEQKEHYTAVLCGNLNLGSIYFKYGCTGANFDYLARTCLWQLGLDYNHGTGHGVGYLLNVHEGPNAVRLKNSDNSVGTVFEEGMITSNEPGVYLEGKYGIRIENLIMCVNDKETEYGKFMKMETLTMVPFDRASIVPEMLDSKQKELLNKYHKNVYETIKPFLTESEKQWLKAETAHI